VKLDNTFQGWLSTVSIASRRRIRPSYVWERNPVEAAGRAMEEWGLVAEVWKTADVASIIHQALTLSPADRAKLVKALSAATPKVAPKVKDPHGVYRTPGEAIADTSHYPAAQRYRLYRVRNGQVVWVWAKSPREAFGRAADTMGVRAKPCKGGRDGSHSGPPA
jgi:hypothetical protein